MVNRIRRTRRRNNKTQPNQITGDSKKNKQISKKIKNGKEKQAIITIIAIIIIMMRKK